MQFSLPVTQSKPMTFVAYLAALAIGHFILASAAEAAAQLAAPAWLMLALQGGAGLAALLGGLLLVWGGWSLAVRLAAWFLPVLRSEPVTLALAEAPPGAASPQIAQQMIDFKAALADIEQNRAKAEVLLTDALHHSKTLVELVKAFAAKAEDFARDAEQHQAALAAIQAGDPLKIAQAAGQMPDAHLRSLLLADVADDKYWAGVARVAAAQLGALQQWSQAYRQFAGRLMLDLAEAKTRLTALEASRDMAQVARPLFEVRTHIHEAQQLLDVRQQAALFGAAGEVIPTLEAARRWQING